MSKKKLIVSILVVAIVLSTIYYLFFRDGLNYKIPLSLEQTLDHIPIWGGIAELDWGGFAHAVKNLSGAEPPHHYGGAGSVYYDKNHRYILAWFKGANIEPKGWHVNTYKPYILEYLKSGWARDHSTIAIGEYLNG